MSMSILVAFFAAVILGGGLVVYALVSVPRLVAAGTLSGAMPQWIVVLVSYVIALVALKIFGTFILPNWSLLLALAFVAITLYHLSWPLQEPGTGAALAIAPVALIAFVLLWMATRGIWAAMPMEGLARLFR